MSQFNSSSHHSHNIQAAIFANCLANSKEIFELIDTVFPIDSCRHYQVLPLGLEGNNLTLGMINPSHEESLKFVNSIAKVFKYNLKLKLIDTQTLEIILASYSQKSQQPQRQDREKDRNKTIIDATVIETDFEPRKSSIESNTYIKKLADSAPTIISEPDEIASSKNSNLPQGLEGLPPDLDFLKDLDLSPKSPKPAADSTATLYEIPPEFINQPVSNNSDDKPTIISDNPAQLLAQDDAQNETKINREQISDSNLDLANWQKIVEEELETEDFLPQLNPQLSWQKLLEQAFRHHSQEINLTRYSGYGSIVASKDELPQSYIEQVPLPIFCSLIDEIKRMARIPLDMSNHPKKVVLERFHNQERVLLRLEFATKNEKETLNIQILRGRTLQIYEQQQMDKASEQALNLAKQLEKTLRRIQACFDSAEFTNLRELQAVQSRINHQLRLLDK